MYKSYALILLVLLAITTGTAQQTAAFTSDYASFNKALSLYNEQQYLAAQTLFDEVKDDTKDETLKGDCAYYIANAAVRLNQQGADALMQKFVKEYPTSTKRNSAFLDVANYYFENGKYAQSRKWYERVDENSISGVEKEEFNFNNGYAHFKSKQYDEAKKYFNRVRDSKTYGSKAKYYEGFIAYESDEYQEADELFEQVEDKEDYKEELAYFKADLNFKLGKFDQAIAEGKAQLPNANRKEQSELNKIIGESYFNLNQFSEALPYLKNYKGKGGKWNNTDYYQLGYAYYKQGDFENAITEFSKIIDGRNSVAQNAYYNLAESYLKTDRKQQALNAFKNASEMDFDEKIKEDSSLNYAKLSYEIGNAYESTPQVIAAHLENYPQSPVKDELETLLIDSYITSKNYVGAMQVLENSRSTQNKAAYQKVAFYRGVELFNDSKYDEAQQAFVKSLGNPEAPIFVARATYWNAEIDFIQNNFSKAIAGYAKFKSINGVQRTDEYTDVDYNLAYAYFSQKEYEQAASTFESYVATNPTNKARLNDAYLRLGDSRFISSSYWPALEAYNKAIETGGADQDYATFQKSMSYGFVDRVAQKIEGLSGFNNRFPTSTYRDDALYELGNVYLAQNKNTEAIAAYDKMIQLVPGSLFASKALLKKALVYDNGQQSDRALTILKQVAAEYPGTPEAVQAVSTAKLIYIDLGRVDEYGKWVSTLNFVDLQDSELDQAAYASAEKQYLENNAPQAQRLFEQYLKDYPQGQGTLKANFYLGQLAFAKANYTKTIPYYTYVLSKERNEFTEQALARLSQVYLSQKNYTAATPVLKRLETEADFPQNIVFAQTNLMKSYFEQQQYAQAVTYAERVLKNTKVEQAVKSDAQVIVARAALQTGDEAKAKTAYAAVKKIATGELAAESRYYEAYFKNKEGDYAGSNAAVQELAKDYSGYKLYGARGLLLMAKNFYGLKDAYQATYILESVTKNFSQYPEVVAEAQTELTKIKAEEAKTNASVEKGN